MNVKIAGITFDRVRYDEAADVLYLHNADPSEVRRFDESPEGHHLRLDADGNLLGITIVRPRWLLENEGEITITFPERVSIQRDQLSDALVAA